MTALLRIATLDDVPTLARLQRNCFDESWSEESFRVLLEGTAFALFAKTAAATELQAFILIQSPADESEILGVGTLPAARRSGLARALIDEGAAEAERRGARTMFLEVADDNSAALALYRSCGFAPHGRRRFYYARIGAPAADALMLRAGLPLQSHGNDAPSRLD